MKTIMEDQEQSDRMKQVCVDNNLLNGEISIDRYFVFGKNFTSNHWKHIVAYRLIEKPNKRIY